MQLALYQPDIPQNLGAIFRLSACMHIPVHIIEPCGFPWDDKRIKRAGMDYIDHVTYHRHTGWEAFRTATQQHRLILMTTKSTDSFYEAALQPDDIILFGRESAGAPQEIHAAADLRLTLPMPGDGRSLNLAMSAAMVTGEIVRQSG